MADLPTASHPNHVCYTRSSWGNAWTEQPLLRCHKLQDRAAPDHATGQFEYRYGEAILPELGSRAADSEKTTISEPSILGLYVKVVLYTDPQTTWYGILTDLDEDRHGGSGSISRGVRTYTAYGLTYLLDRQPITQSWVDDDGTDILVDVVLPFNGGTDGRASRDRVVSANYDSSGVFASNAWSSIPSYWTAANAASYLLTKFPPRDIDDVAHVTFLISTTLGQLKWQLPFMHYEGQTVWRVLNRLVPRQRGLGLKRQLTDLIAS